MQNLLAMRPLLFSVFLFLSLSLSLSLILSLSLSFFLSPPSPTRTLP